MKTIWKNGQPVGISLDDLVYRIQSRAGWNLLEAPVVPEFDAMTVPNKHLAITVEMMKRYMEGAGLFVTKATLGDIIVKAGRQVQPAFFFLADGQVITAWFINPNQSSTHRKPNDVLVVFKWFLNREDITDDVWGEMNATVRTYTLRVAMIAEKNSNSFTWAERQRADYMERIMRLETEIERVQKAINLKAAQIALVEEEAKDMNGRIAADMETYWKPIEHDPFAQFVLISKEEMQRKRRRRS